MPPIIGLEHRRTPGGGDVSAAEIHSIKVIFVERATGYSSRRSGGVVSFSQRYNGRAPRNLFQVVSNTARNLRGSIGRNQHESTNPMLGVTRVVAPLFYSHIIVRAIGRTKTLRDFFLPPEHRQNSPFRVFRDDSERVTGDSGRQRAA